MEFKHVSVLLEECMEGLNLKQGGIYVDGTLGGAGHSSEICRRLEGKGTLIGIDQDEAAICAAKKRLEPYPDMVKIVRSNYCEMPSVLNELQIPGVDGILLDLGVSSYQLDEAERGFSYREDAALDMRMDRRQPFSAWDVVNTYTEEELLKVLWDYGEEKFARNIVRRIIKAREQAPIDTTGQLCDLIYAAIPAKARSNSSGHPAKRTFQAIRIEVNHELDVLINSLDAMIDQLNDGGRLCVITFHSLEDRIVKNAFRKNENPCICPKEFPICVCKRKSKGRVVTRKPILPSKEEMEVNPRSKSAKLRVFERSIR